MNDEASRAIIQARSDLILGPRSSDTTKATMAFFGQLAFHLNLIEDETIPTACTDGINLVYNPRYLLHGIEKGHESERIYGDDVRVSLVCHEVWHCADDHAGREEGRDHDIWNKACDYIVNAMLKKAGFRLGDGWLYNPAFSGKSPEWIYEKIYPEEKKKQDQRRGGCTLIPQGGQGGGDKPGQNDSDSDGGDGNSQDAPCGPGEFRKPSAKDGDVQTVADEWKSRITAAARTAAAIGDLPAAIKSLVKDIENPKVNWRSVLRKLMQACARTDFTWRLPNKRYLPLGLFMPTLYSDQMGPVVIQNDASGSRDFPEARKECMSELAAIIREVRPEITYVNSFDTKVYPLGEFTPDDQIDITEFIGGGGTDFRNLHKWSEERGIEPACEIIITDGEGHFGEAPSWPVIWCITTDVVAPYGETIRL